MSTHRLFPVLIAILLLTTLFAGLTTVAAAASTTATAGTTANKGLARTGSGVNVQASNTKYFVFRDDDIAPFGELAALQALNQVHIDKNVPVTLGIVAHPDPYSGNELFADTDTLSYLQTLVTNPLFEFAQHGYTHIDDTQSTVGAITPPKSITGASPYRMTGTAPYQERLFGASALSEFSGRSYTTQYNTIQQGRQDIIQALGVTPKTFIPPWNDGDENTLRACTALGFTLYSTGWDDFGTFDAYMDGIQVQAAHFSIGWDTHSEWQAGMAQLTSDTDSYLNSASSGQSFMLFYHYWQFLDNNGSVDPYRIQLFEQYIDHLKARGDVQFTTSTPQNKNVPIGLAPAVCAQDANSLDLFAKGPDWALWWKHWNGQGWSAWTSLGGYLTADPAAVSRGEGVIDVFVRGSNGALWQREYNNGWGSWSSLGGQLASGTGPAACSWGAGRLDVFVTGTSGVLWHWSGSWDQSLGGYTTSSPAATSPTSGVIDVFVRGSNGALWQREYNNGWGSWSSLGGQLASGTGPAACSWGAGRLDVFVTGTSGVLWHWSGSWDQSLGGYTTSSPAATSPTSGVIDVFVRGSNGALWQKSYNNGWGGWTSIRGI